MFPFLVPNKSAPLGSKCANCENTEIDSDAYMLVSGEPMCDGCIDQIACCCENCDAIVMSDDCEQVELQGLTCRDCIAENYRQCKECDSLVPHENCTHTLHDFICPDCERL